MNKIYKGMTEIISKWAIESMDDAYRWYVEGVAAFDCHERVAVDLGGLKSKIATLYSMDLITPGEYTALLRFADDSFEEVQAYIWEDLFQEEDA